MDNNSKDTGNKFFTILGWLIGGMLVLVGVFALFANSGDKKGVMGNIFMSLSLLLSGAVLIPPLLIKIRAFLPFMNKIFWPPLASFLIFIFTAAIGSSMLPPVENKTNNSSNNSQNQATTSSPAIKNEAKKEELTTQEAEVLKSDLKELWSKTIEIASSCDSDFKKLLVGMGNGRLDQYSAYEIATSAVNSCRDAAMNYTELKVPNGLKGKEAEDLKSALDACEMAYINKQMAAEKIAKGLDTGVKPSLVHEIKELSENAQKGQLFCGIGVAAAATAKGVDIGGEKEKKLKTK